MPECSSAKPPNINVPFTHTTSIGHHPVFYFILIINHYCHRTVILQLYLFILVIMHSLTSINHNSVWDQWFSSLITNRACVWKNQQGFHDLSCCITYLWGRKAIWCFLHITVIMSDYLTNAEQLSRLII